MNTFKKIKIILLISLCFFGFSCKKFLEPKSQSQYIPATADQLNELILSAYTLPTDPYTDFTGGFLDVLTDDIETVETIDERYSGDVWYSNFSYVSAVYAMYTWQPQYSVYMANNGYTSYARIYQNIYTKLVYVNSTLDYVDKVTGSTELKNYAKAQALALRAFYYFHLVNLYGEPYSVNPDGQGVPIRTTGAAENRPMARNTVREVYNLIVSDLLESIDLFSGLASTHQYGQYKANLPMALLLLSRTYLYMENWQQAEFYAAKLIKDWPQFQIKNLNDLITAGFTNVNASATTTSNADIRRKQLFYPDFTTYNNSDVIWAYGSASDVTSLTRNDFYSASSTSLPRVAKNNVYASLTRASSSLIGSYAGNDLRLRTYFVRNLFSEPDYSTTAFSLSSLASYRAYGKILIYDNGTGIPNYNFRFTPRVESRDLGQTFRITEAYLILAEAQAMQGKNAEATQTLNNIWSKRFASGTPPPAYTTGDMIDVVRNERRREFCFESLRWFDLRRWGMPRVEHVWYDITNRNPYTFVLEKGDAGYTIPLPHTIMSSNSALTQVPLGGDGNERSPQ
jgi:hypothetical protein